MVSQVSQVYTVDEHTYLESLRWRRGDLQSRLGQLKVELDRLSHEESGVNRELQALDVLLAAAEQPATNASVRPTSPIGSAGDTLTLAPVGDTDPSAFGPTARVIYARAEEIIRDAGVPLHYRILADEIQKRVPLSGADPGATLIAHLHRAPHLFPRVGRGIYAIPEVVPFQDGKRSNSEASTGRRKPRVRRRTK